MPLERRVDPERDQQGGRADRDAERDPQLPDVRPERPQPLRAPPGGDRDREQRHRGPERVREGEAEADRKSTRLNSSHPSHLVCRLLLEKKTTPGRSQLLTSTASISRPSAARGNFSLFFFFFNDTATTEIYTLSLHDALPI